MGAARIRSRQLIRLEVFWPQTGPGPIWTVARDDKRQSGRKWARPERGLYLAFIEQQFQLRRIMTASAPSRGELTGPARSFVPACQPSAVEQNQ